MPISPAAMRQIVEELAATPRPAESPALESAREFTERRLRDAGWPVRRETFTVEGLRGVNLVAEVEPAGGRLHFVVGAHLDSRPETPGADDNASAVAALLELAREVRSSAEGAPVHLQLAVYDLEESGMLGSALHADQFRTDGSDLAGMISLEMLGYADSAPGSQMVPEQLAGLYPTVGDFIAVVGNERSAPLVQSVAGAMCGVTDLNVETLAVPGNGEILPPVRLSDHSPFWDRGFRALMITDTSFFRNPHYHLASDTPDTLDFLFLARVTEGVVAAVAALIQRTDA